MFKKFDENQEDFSSLPEIDSELIRCCQIALQMPYSSRRGGSKPSESKMIVIQNLQRLNQSTLKLPLVNADNLQGIMESERNYMVVAIENNIKQHFLVQYINRYVNVVFEEDLKEKRVTRSELWALKNDLRNNTTRCDAKFHEWLEARRYLIVPKQSTKDYVYDIEVCYIFCFYKIKY
jgi:hypothetical protein